jgi:hypothetical protein
MTSRFGSQALGVALGIVAWAIPGAQFPRANAAEVRVKDATPAPKVRKKRRGRPAPIEVNLEETPPKAAPKAPPPPTPVIDLDEEPSKPATPPSPATGPSGETSPEPAPTKENSGEQVIEDPELKAQGTSSPSAAGASVDGEQVIDDPELAGTASKGATSGNFGDVGGPRDARWGVTLHTRWGYDTQAPQHGHSNQDIVEGTTVLVLEVQQRRSDELFYSLGLRMRHSFATPRSGEPNYDLDVAPVSGFVDVTPTPGFHLRAGYQDIAMGRFDVFTATNFLQVLDLRSGPVTMAEAAAIAQPAVRLDWDGVSGLTVQAFYVPFFQPHLYPVYGSNYAPVDRFTGIIQGVDQLRTQLDQVLVRSKLSRASTSFGQAFAPAPDFLRPQGAIRTTWSGSAGELAVTLGTAIDHLPSEFRFTPGATPAADGTGGTLPKVEIAHDRFYIASMDGAVDVGRFQLGAEAAYLAHRTMSAVGTLAGDTGAADDHPTFTGHVNLFHGGLRAEMVEQAGWSAAIETFVLVALSDPSFTPPDNRQWLREPRWLAMEGGRFNRGIAGGVQFAPEDTGLKFEIGAVAYTGPSYVLAPRIEYEALTRLYLELGGVFVAGPAPGAPGSPNVSLAGLYSDIDQVFLGLKWIP